MKEQSYLTKNKFTPVFFEALAHLHYQSLWQARGYLPLPYSEGLAVWIMSVPYSPWQGLSSALRL